MFRRLISLYRRHATEMSDVCCGSAVAFAAVGAAFPALEGFRSGWTAGAAFVAVGAFYLILGLSNLQRRASTFESDSDAWRDQPGKGFATLPWNERMTAVVSSEEAAADISRDGEPERAASEMVEV